MSPSPHPAKKKEETYVGDTEEEEKVEGEGGGKVAARRKGFDCTIALGTGTEYTIRWPLGGKGKEGLGDVGKVSARGRVFPCSLAPWFDAGSFSSCFWFSLFAAGGSSAQQQSPSGFLAGTRARGVSRERQKTSKLRCFKLITSCGSASFCLFFRASSEQRRYRIPRRSPTVVVVPPPVSPCLRLGFFFLSAFDCKVHGLKADATARPGLALLGTSAVVQVPIYAL